MRNEHPSAVPNYTNAFLTTLGGILFMGFWVLTSLTSIITTLVIATLIDRSIRHFGR